MSAAPRVRPLAPAVGAAVEDVDLSRPVDDDVFAVLHRAFLEHCVLVFPGQFLEPEAHARFARLWGEPMVVPYLADHAEPGFPELLHVTNLGKDKAVTESWHFDSAFFPDPPSITILAAQKLPEVGGDTMWANQYLAYELLSERMQEILEGLEAEFCGARPSPDTGEREEISKFHPVVSVHPETGRKALRVGHPGDSVRAFHGMTEEESRPLLEFLYEHASRPDITYRHHWSQGDVVMWDNRALMHYAIHDYGDAVRRLNRITVDGSPW